jgi:hypothetical protein
MLKMTWYRSLVSVFAMGLLISVVIWGRCHERFFGIDTIADTLPPPSGAQNRTGMASEMDQGLTPPGYVRSPPSGAQSIDRRHVVAKSTRG